MNAAPSTSTHLRLVHSSTTQAQLLRQARYDGTIPAGARLLLLDIAELAERTGCCYASPDHFVQLYEVSRSTVFNWFGKLQARGYIVRTEWQGQPAYELGAGPTGADTPEDDAPPESPPAGESENLDSPESENLDQSENLDCQSENLDSESKKSDSPQSKNLDCTQSIYTPPEGETRARTHEAAGAGGKPQIPSDPALAYQHITGRPSHLYWDEEIRRRVGSDPDRRKAWVETCFVWSESYRADGGHYNTANVRGMLKALDESCRTVAADDPLAFMPAFGE